MGKMFLIIMLGCMYFLLLYLRYCLYASSFNVLLWTEGLRAGFIFGVIPLVHFAIHFHYLKKMNNVQHVVDFHVHLTSFTKRYILLSVMLGVSSFFVSMSLYPFKQCDPGVIFISELIFICFTYLISLNRYFLPFYTEHL